MGHVYTRKPRGVAQNFAIILPVEVRNHDLLAEPTILIDENSPVGEILAEAGAEAGGNYIALCHVLTASRSAPQCTKINSFTLNSVCARSAHTAGSSCRPACSPACSRKNSSHASSSAAVGGRLKALRYIPVMRSRALPGR